MYRVARRQRCKVLEGCGSALTCVPFSHTFLPFQQGHNPRRRGSAFKSHARPLKRSQSEGQAGGDDPGEFPPPLDEEQKGPP